MYLYELRIKDAAAISALVIEIGNPDQMIVVVLRSDSKTQIEPIGKSDTNRSFSSDSSCMSADKKDLFCVVYQFRGRGMSITCRR